MARRQCGAAAAAACCCCDSAAPGARRDLANLLGCQCCQTVVLVRQLVHFPVVLLRHHVQAGRAPTVRAPRLLPQGGRNVVAVAGLRM